MKVIIPVFKDTVSASVVGIMDLLTHSREIILANSSSKNENTAFEVNLMSIEADKVVNNNGFLISCSSHINDNLKADLIVVPAIIGNLPELLETHKTLLDWLLKQHKNGASLCSTCTGSFFIASTGLLDNLEATTSWFASDLFKKLYPKVILKDEKIIVDNGKIITGGATLSYPNLCIYLIEKYYGKKAGNHLAKLFLVDKGKSSQLSYSIFTMQKNHSDKEILKAQEIIEESSSRKISVTEVSQQMAMSERSFIRRFKSATGNTPSEYIQRVKVEKAKYLLEDGKESVKEISYSTGYEDLNYFRDVFKKYVGLTPFEYRKMFSFSISNIN